jgi:PleD family two-component response regulator
MKLPPPTPDPSPPLRGGGGERESDFQIQKAVHACHQSSERRYNAVVTDRILLIEDDPSLAEMVKSYLGEAGFRVSIAGRGEAGIAMSAREPFDSIILDLMLPDMDGLEVCRRRSRS